MILIQTFIIPFYINSIASSPMPKSVTPEGHGDHQVLFYSRGVSEEGGDP